jgi:putative intracellular protease/amidase
MGKKVAILASNLGLWAEELEAPWDALKNAGFELTLATPQGKKPLSLLFSVDPDFFDPVQRYNVNPPEVVERVREIYAHGEWDNPVPVNSLNMDDYDAIVVVGGPGSPLDLAGNSKVHQLLEQAYASNKTIGALCYAVGALVWARNPSDWNKSIIYGKQVAAHPREWDFTGDLPYFLADATPDNPGTDLVTPGFVYPLSPIVVDAVGPNGKVYSDPNTTREHPLVVYDPPFVTALSVESSIAFGQKLVEVLSAKPAAVGA